MKRLDHITCDVCYTTISFPYNHNQFTKKNDHFVDVCLEHKNYAKTFLIEVVSENLGFKDIEKRCCDFCKKPITEREIQKSLEVNSFHFLCQNHLDRYCKIFILPKK